MLEIIIKLIIISACAHWSVDCLFGVALKLYKFIKPVSRKQGRTRSTPYQCSICLEDVRLAMETNCGHVFCSLCLVEWIQTARSTQSSLPSTIPCPNCRQRVTRMQPYFTEEENRALGGDSRLVELMTDYNRMNEEESSLKFVFISLRAICTYEMYLYLRQFV